MSPSNQKSPQFYAITAILIAILFLCIIAFIVTQPEKPPDDDGDRRPEPPRQYPTEPPEDDEPTEPPEDDEPTEPPDRPENDNKEKFPEAGDFPHHVMITHLMQHQCSGSLISKRLVLTTAICIRAAVMRKNLYEISNFFICMGVAGPDYDVRAIHTVQGVLLHPSNNCSTIKSNIAIIKLFQEVDFNKYVNTIALPNSDPNLSAGGKLIATGYANYCEPFPSKKCYIRLAEFTFSVVDKKICQEYHPSLDLSGKFCALFIMNQHCRCLGDDGGPVFTSDNVPIGIVTRGSNGDCNRTNPYVFTYVPDFLNFVKSEMSN